MRPVTASSWWRTETKSNGQRINDGKAVAAPMIDGACTEGEFALTIDGATLSPRSRWRLIRPQPR
jgi:hypothetical protein